MYRKLPLIAVAISLMAFAGAPLLAPEHLKLARFLSGLVGLGALAWHVLVVDEVERLLIWKSASIGFGLSLVAAWAAATVGLSAPWHHAWAAMMAIWLLAYAALRWWPR